MNSNKKKISQRYSMNLIELQKWSMNKSLIRQSELLETISKSKVRAFLQKIQHLSIKYYHEILLNLMAKELGTKWKAFILVLNSFTNNLNLIYKIRLFKNLLIWFKKLRVYQQDMFMRIPQILMSIVNYKDIHNVMI